MKKVNVEDYKWRDKRKAKAWNDLINIVETLNYRLLNEFKEYKGTQSKLKFQCNENHIFEMPAHAFKRGNMCPYCSGNKSTHKDGFWGETKDLAEKENYKLLSPKEDYKTVQSKLTFKCDNGHIFEMTANKFKNMTTRCPICSGHKSTHSNGFYGEIKDLAESVGYKILSKKEDYKNNKSKLTFQCDKGHVFEMSATHFKTGHRCPYCAGFKSSHKNGFYGEVKDLTESTNYKLLSIKEDYKNSQSKLKFQCDKNHIFEMTARDFKSAARCPYCSSLKSEQKTREIFQELFQLTFNKIRPEWLKHKRHPLELDGYSKSLQLAFEYQGIQHYEFVPFFHKTKQNFIARQKRDQFKRDKCKEKEVTLIEIPYWINLDELEGFLIDELLKQKRLDLILWINYKKLNS